MCPKGGTDFESITSEFPMVLKTVDRAERKKDLQNKKDQISLTCKQSPQKAQQAQNVPEKRTSTP